MIVYLENAKRYLWLFVEIGFLLVLAIVLVYLILGESSGDFVTSVVRNVTKLAADIPQQSLVGLAIVLALVFLLSNRLKA